MGILTMKIFIDALDASDEVLELAERRIWPVAVPGSDEEFENVELPYIVVGYSGPNNQPETKDQIYYGDNDQEQVHVLMVAKDIDELADLEDKVRRAIITYFEALEPGDENYGLLPDNGATAQGDMVEYNPWKPDFSHTLTYNCETKAFQIEN